MKKIDPEVAREEKTGEKLDPYAQRKYFGVFPPRCSTKEEWGNWGWKGRWARKSNKTNPRKIFFVVFEN